MAFLFFLSISAQQKKDSLALRFHLKFKDNEIVTHNNYISKQDTLEIEVFRFYIADIEIEYADHSILKTKTSHLIDLEIPESQQIRIDSDSQKSIKQIAFSIGVDSLSNVSGALSGDLDPAKGMYWAWQSGYINMKLEGKSPSCKTRNNKFQFHLGGYLKPYNARRKVVLNLNENKAAIDIAVDTSIFFSEIALQQTHSIMIPGKRAMELADLSTKMFRLE